MEQFYRRVMSGEDHGVIPSLVRAIARLAEPIYSAIVSSRNSSYSRGVLRTTRVGRPVISVGNITTGGTGKTPVVKWMADALRDRGLNVAILMRGYKSSSSAGSDEQILLQQLLNSAAGKPQVIVHVNPDRVAAATDVLRDHPKTDVFILDDGFQHRRIHRDFDLVLIDATNPFGYDHVLPRGLLREPLRNLSRANAFLITRIDQALPNELPEIESCLQREAPAAPIYHCSHIHRNGNVAIGKPAFVFSAIGNPDAFERQLSSAGVKIVGHRRFGDHYSYHSSDLAALQSAAKSCGAETMITTEKDWVKLAPMIPARAANSIPIRHVELDIQFLADDKTKLLDQLLVVVAGARSIKGL